jgi:hypothetical protein
MKPLQYEFVEPTAWRWVWGFALIAGVCIAGAGLVAYQKTVTQHTALQDKLATLQGQLTRAQVQPIVAGSPQLASLQRVAKHVQQDMNVVFAAPENLQESGTRLKGLTWDASSNTLKLEFELDSVVQASAVTLALNTGYDAGPWQFESVSSAGVQSTAVGNGLQLNLPSFRGVWWVDVGRL